MSLSIPYVGPVRTPGGAVDMPVVYFNDFLAGGDFSETANAADFLASGAGTSTFLQVDSATGGQVGLTNASSDNDCTQCQLNGEPFQVSSTQDLVFECKMHVDSITLSDWWVGLAATDTSILEGTANFIGFGNSVNAADVYANCGNTASGNFATGTAGTNETLTDTGVNLVASTFTTLRFEVIGNSKVRYYVDGVLKATHTTNIPTVTMTPTMAIRNASGVSRTMTVDWVLAYQDRD